MRILLSLLSLLVTLGVSAQSEASYHSLLEEGKSWVYDYHHFEEHENEPTTEKVYPVRYTLLGDTLIGDKSYYKMYQEQDNQTAYYGAYREEGLKVFARFPLIDKDIIVADFEYKGLYDPDGYNENDSYSTIKEYIDYIEVDGIKYRRHTYYESEKEERLVIGVEGIGYTKYGLKYPSIYGPEPDCLCDYEVFTSCELNGKCIFTNEDFYKEAVAQDGNFFPTGMKWQEAIVQDGVINMVGNHTHTYEIGSDKSFGDVVYKEVFVDGTAANLWVREEGNKVWLLSEDYSQEILLYDFNWDAETGLLHTEYLKGNDNGYDVKTLESLAAYRTLTINGRDYQYHQEDAGTVIRNIGRVYELNRNSSLLGYKVPEGIVPGLIYWKVLWIEKGGEVVFQSDSPGEWNMHLGNPPVVTIDGLWYFIYKPSHLAMLANYNLWAGKLDIPEQVSYEGEEYTVDRIEWLAFNQCQTLTKVRIPKTVRDIQHYAGYEDCKNPFDGCSSLESIEVDKDNPRMCSVDGVLFSKDKTMLYCYPAGAKSESYTVPDGVTWIGSGAFGYNGLTLLDIPKSVQGFGEGVFRWTHLKKIAIRGTFPNGLRNDTFDAMDEATVLYVRQSEIEKFKKVYAGTVLPLEEYTNGIEQIKQHQPLGTLYDLQGRRLNAQPTKGIYIQNGKKVVIK